VWYRSQRNQWQAVDGAVRLRGACSEPTSQRFCEKSLSAKDPKSAVRRLPVTSHASPICLAKFVGGSGQQFHSSAIENNAVAPYRVEQCDGALRDHRPDLFRVFLQPLFSVCTDEGPFSLGSADIDLVLAQIVIDYKDHNPVVLLYPLHRYIAVGEVLNY
jgi:hypothetical protein